MSCNWRIRTLEKFLGTGNKCCQQCTRSARQWLNYRISVKFLLKTDIKHIPKVRHSLHRKEVREGRESLFLNSIDTDNEALAIVGSDIASFWSGWVGAVPKAAAFTMYPPEFRSAMRNRLLFPHHQIIPNS